MPGGENFFVDDFTSSGTTQKRKLGNSNLEVSAIGFGCMGMSFGYGPAKKEMIAHTQSSRTRHYIFLILLKAMVSSGTRNLVIVIQVR
jgi:hypothetical protein